MEKSSGSSVPAGLHQQVISRMPLGFVLLCLDDPADLLSFRLVEANRAASELASFPLEQYIGKKATEFPLLDLDRLKFFAELVRGGVERSLGEMRGRVPDLATRTFSLHAIPFEGRFLALLIEEVTGRSK